MSLSTGEAVALGGKVLINVGEALAGDKKITRDEWIEIIKGAATDAWDEYSDDNDFPNVE